MLAASAEATAPSQHAFLCRHGHDAALAFNQKLGERAFEAESRAVRERDAKQGV